MTKTGLWIGLIPARGGSKGIPRKNLRVLLGKPLIAHAISVAKSSPSLDHVVVSTDDEEIAQVAKSYGAEVPFMRPAAFATDQSPMMPVMTHAVESCEKIYGQKIEAVVLLDPTSPLRTSDDVEGAVKMFRGADCDTVVSGTVAHRHPHFNMVTVEDGWAKLMMTSDKPVGRRQDAPPAFDLDTTAWVFSRKTILETKERIPAKTKLFLVPKERSHDLDTEDDWRFVEFLMSASGARR